MKYKIKITLSMLCLVALLFGIGGSAMISLSFHSNFSQARERAAQSYQSLLSTLSYVSQISDWTSLSDIINTIDQFYAQSGSAPAALLLSDRESGYTVGGAGSVLESLLEDMELEEGGIVLFESEGRYYLGFSQQVQFMDETLCLDAAYDISPTYENRSQMHRTYRWIFAAMALTCTVLAYTISTLLTKQLSQLLTATDELAKGNLKFRSNIHSNDEIGTLSTGFDAMAERIEESVKAMQDALERQERFMGSFSHELKTPLTSMIGYAELIQSQTLSAEDEMDAAYFIYSEAKRLENLSLKLLDILVADKQSLNMVSVAPASLISETAEHLRPSYRKLGIGLEYQCEEGVCSMDPDLVKSLLLNLMDNGKKAIGSGGTIRILSQMTDEGWVLLVEDNGKGIPPEALAHLTEAFYRVDKSRSREQGGVGLGLTLCAKIVELHHGTIRFESAEGKGTTVIVTLKGGGA